MSFRTTSLTVIALEQTAALVEAKVTPRLTTLLDSLKDEKKSSLAVADPKLGIEIILQLISIANSVLSWRYQ